MSNYYQSLADIGSHESFLKKVGDFTGMTNSFWVTYVENSTACILYGKGSYILTAGTVIGANALLKTNNAKVEIVSTIGDIIRLDVNSEFCIEHTLEGLAPVFYGSVMVFPINNKGKGSHGKYRTSCWTACSDGDYLIKNIDETTDRYYSFEGAYDVYEYDEQGKKFLITHLEPFQTCDLYFDHTKPCRDAYKIINTADLTASEITDIYTKYVIPIDWNEKFSDQKCNRKAS